MHSTKHTRWSKGKSFTQLILPQTLSTQHIRFVVKMAPVERRPYHLPRPSRNVWAGEKLLKDSCHFRNRASQSVFWSIESLPSSGLSFGQSDSDPPDGLRSEGNQVLSIQPSCQGADMSLRFIPTTVDRYCTHSRSEYDVCGGARRNSIAA